MTQKELLYLEDAVGHEQSIMQILEISIENLDDEELVSFLKEELRVHESINKKLLKKMEAISNG